MKLIKKNSLKRKSDDSNRNLISNQTVGTGRLFDKKYKTLIIRFEDGVDIDLAK